MPATVNGREPSTLIKDHQETMFIHYRVAPKRTKLGTPRAITGGLPAFPGQPVFHLSPLTTPFGHGAALPLGAPLCDPDGCGAVLTPLPPSIVGNVVPHPGGQPKFAAQNRLTASLQNHFVPAQNTTRMTPLDRSKLHGCNCHSRYVITSV